MTIIDLDPQGQCATLLGMKRKSTVFHLLVTKNSEPIQELICSRNNLYLLSGDEETATAQVVLSAQRAPISRVRDIAKGTKSEYVIIDTAPSVGDLQGMALWAADYVLIPTACEFASIEGVFMIENTLKKLMDEYSWRGELLGILPTFYDETTRETRSAIEDLRKHFDNALLAPIHTATILRESMAAGKTIFEYSPTSRAAREYARLVEYTRKVTR